MYQRVFVIGVGITTVKQACQNLSLAAPLVFLATSRHWSLSKILEKIVYTRLHLFSNINNNISQQQFGFRHKHSTNHATTLLVRNIVDAFERKQLILGIFVDISKTFDTIDH